MISGQLALQASLTTERILVQYSVHYLTSCFIALQVHFLMLMQ